MRPESIRPVTADRWPDLERLFGPSGAYSGCWCMWWRLRGSEFDAAGGRRRRSLLQARVQDGPPPGLLAYDDSTPVGWIALAPRQEFGRLQRSPKLKPVDGAEVCSVTCFFVARGHRRQGVASALLAAAVDHAAANGGHLVEGYPVDRAEDTDDAAAFTGTLGLFTAAGFTEVARRGGRPIVRRRIIPR